METSVYEHASLPTIVLTLIVSILGVVILGCRFHVFWYRCPGPWGIPFFGFYPFLRKDYYVQLAEMAKLYGDAYIINLGGKPYLHLSSYKALRETHITKSDCFPGRSHDFSAMQHLFEYGVPFINDEAWRLWRRFVAQSMRELGLTAKEQLEGELLDAVRATLNALSESQGQPVDISDLLAVQCTKVIRRITLGKKITYEESMKFNKEFHRSNLIIGDLGMLLRGNIARYLILPRNKLYKEMIAARKVMDSMLYDIIADHKKNFDPEHPKDFIDLYLREKKVREERNDPQSQYFTDKFLVGTLKQIYGDGGHGIGTYTASFLTVLASKVDVQNAVYEEIVQEIGTERLPAYEDRNKLPFTNCVIKEIERTTGFLPIVPSLECTRDTTVSGAYVPKGALTLLNLYAIYKDPTEYKDPERFDPERFMPDEKTKRPKEEPPVSFGVGKRACAGEALVKYELFVFLTAIIQRFSVQMKKTGSSEQSGVMWSEEMQLLAIPRSNSSNHL